ncbi:MAG: OsmC family protein [Gemmatimonadaceae bacterium]
MSDHRAHIRWRHDGGDFAKRQYSRAHSWLFDGGLTVPASSSPSNVPIPYSDPAGVDPEEAYVAAISSCHMLTFLFVAANARIVVLSYEDEAIGSMTPNERGVPWMSHVELHPRIAYAQGAAPTADEEAELHHRAHDGCYIANSVRTEITVRAGAPQDASAPSAPTS